MNKIEELVYNNIKYNLYKPVEYKDKKLYINDLIVIPLEYTARKKINFYMNNNCIIAIVSLDSSVVYYRINPFN